MTRNWLANKTLASWPVVIVGYHFRGLLPLIMGQYYYYYYTTITTITAAAITSGGSRIS